MKRICLGFLLIIGQAITLYGQDHYRQDFLKALSTLPDLKTCEAAYGFIACKNHSCDVYTQTKADLTKANNELIALENATSGSMGYAPGPMMNPEEAKKMQEKLKEMTPEERKQWAMQMQNSQNGMAAGNPHANKDLNNQQVMDAVRIVTDQKNRDARDTTTPADYSSQYMAIEAKFGTHKADVLKKFQAASGTTNDPSSNAHYDIGETARDEQAARYDRALETYKKNMLPIYDSEMLEKLRCVIQTKQSLIQKYTPIEQQIALTHYTDDAKEPINKLNLIMGHLNVLQKVTQDMHSYEDVLSQYAGQYAKLMGLDPAKK